MCACLPQTLHALFLTRRMVRGSLIPRAHAVPSAMRSLFSLVVVVLVVLSPSCSVPIPSHLPCHCLSTCPLARAPACVLSSCTATCCALCASLPLPVCLTASVLSACESTVPSPEPEEELLPFPSPGAWWTPEPDAEALGSWEPDETVL